LSLLFAEVMTKI